MISPGYSVDTPYNGPDLLTAITSLIMIESHLIMIESHLIMTAF